MKRDEREHLSRLSGLGCLVCRRLHGPHDPGPVEIHHRRAGTGAGRRSSHWDALPLCVEHHRGKTGVHGMGTKAFVRHYGVTEQELVDEVYQLLNEEKRRI